MKKFFKIIGIILLILILLLAAIPIVLESKIDAIVQNYADENLNAKLSFDDISLSLLSSFPKAEVNVDNLKIVTLTPFEDETLVTAKSISFEMPIGELFKGRKDEPLTVNEIITDELLLTIKTNKVGIANYNIVKENSEDSANQSTNGGKGNFNFDIKNYEIHNSAFTYIDEASNTTVYITELNHSGDGIFSDGISQLDTNTETKVSLFIDSTAYLRNNILKLDALIDLDLERNKYAFKENKGFINALPLEFEGYIQQLEVGQQIDLSFKNPEASFKDFLALIPKDYTKSVENVETTGGFIVNGMIKGVLSDDTIPKLDINIVSNNASFKYPDLPKRIEDISINASVKNTTGKTKDTYIDLNKLDFKIDEDVFKSEAHIKELTKAIIVDANIDGTLNLGNLTKAYPIELENELSGILKGKLNTKFDMEAIKNNTFERIKNNGGVTISNFIFSSEDIVNPIQINAAEVNFKPGTVSLNSFDAITGSSDFNATGTIKNLIGFLLSDNKLQGNFDVKSSTFVISDFMVEGETNKTNSKKTTSDEESLKIPDFLDCSITANANTVVYDNLTLKNVKGILEIKDQNANLKNMTTDLFDGQLGISGNVSTKEVKPKFSMKLGMNQFDISQSFKGLKILEALAPIAKVIQGKLNSTIDISGILDKSFSPDLSTITGNALAEILTSNINANQSPLLSGLENQLSFLDFKKLDLKDLKTKLSFDNGEVSVKPFTILYEDVPIEVSGSHSFSKNLKYDVVFQVPAKYLGSDVNRLIGKINDPEVNKISIPVTANINGNLKNPNISTDLTSGITKLTAQLIEIEKQKLIDKGSDKVKGLIGGLLGGDDKNDSTKTDKKDKIKEGVNSVLGGIIGSKRKKKAQDSTKN